MPFRRSRSSRSTCGNPGYSYAGVVTPKRTAGVRAVDHRPVAPQVESGDVSGWIGVGRVGVNGKRGVLRVGLLGEADGTMQLYYEVRRNGELDPAASGPSFSRESGTSSRSCARGRTPSAGAC